MRYPVIILCLLLSVAACKKDKNTTNQPVTETAMISLSIDGSTTEITANNGDFASGESAFINFDDSTIEVHLGNDQMGAILSFPVHISGVGTYTAPQTLITGNNQRHFEGSYVKDNIIYDHEHVTRQMNSGVCDIVQKEVTVNTITISQWSYNTAPIATNCEGTFSGTLYDNLTTDPSCSNSVAHSYSGSFKFTKQ